MKDETKDKIYTILTVTLVLLVLAGDLVKASPRYSQYRALKAKVAAIEAKASETARKTAELVEKQRRFQTDREFVESIARQNHRVYPGELVFLFPEQDRR